MSTTDPAGPGRLEPEPQPAEPTPPTTEPTEPTPATEPAEPEKPGPDTEEHDTLDVETEDE